MRKQFVKILSGFACALALSLGMNAQTQPEIKVVLPFDFMIDGKTLPAGAYTVGLASDDKLSRLVLRSDKTGESVFVRVLSIDSSRTAKPSVEFRRIGESYFLSKIEISGDVYSVPSGRAQSTNQEAKSVRSASGSTSAGE